MPAKRTHSVTRSFWRFFEISLFFLVSVLGYNFLAKATSINAKSKSREHAERSGTIVALPVELSLERFFSGIAAPSCPQPIVTDCHDSSLSPCKQFYAMRFPALQPHTDLFRLHATLRSNLVIPPCIPSLLQQKQVLII